MSYGDSLSKGKSVAGYVVYEVDKNAKYELHFAPSFYDDIKENSKKNNDVAIKVDPSQYEDNIDEAKDVMKKYVDAVYLNGESSGGGTNLSATDNKSQVVALADDKKSSDNSAEFTNDAKADKEEFIKKFTESFGKGFYNYKPSDSELRTFADAYIKANEDEALKFTAEETGLSIEAVKSMYPQYDFSSKITADDIKALEATQEFMLESKMIEHKIDIKSLLLN